MKKVIFSFLLCAFTFIVCQAQPDFKKVWESKSTVKPTWRTYNNDLSLVLVGDLKVLEMNSRGKKGD